MPQNIGDHFRTVMVGVTTAGIMWMANSVSDTRAVVAGLDARMNAISGQIVNLSQAIRDASANAMPRDEAQAQLGDTSRRIDRIDRAEQADARLIANMERKRR